MAWGFALEDGGCGVRLDFSIVAERRKQLSAKGDELERLSAVIDWSCSAAIWNGRYRARMAHGRGPSALDHVLMLQRR